MLYGTLLDGKELNHQEIIRWKNVQKGSARDCNKDVSF